MKHDPTYNTKTKSFRGISFADALRINGDHVTSNSRCKVKFQVEDSDLVWFLKAYVGFFENPNITTNMQEIFNTKGYFTIWVTQLWRNLCLLEDRVEGEIQVLVNDKGNWLNQMYKDVRPWKPSSMDDERVTWIWCYGIPCHAWSPDFFEALVSPLGAYLCRNNCNTPVFELLLIYLHFNLIIMRGNWINLGDQSVWPWSGDVESK